MHILAILAIAEVAIEFLRLKDPSPAQIKAARRAYRRISGILAHPLFPYAGMSEQGAATLRAARDALGPALGYTEELGNALAQFCIDNEIRVRLQDDGSYRFTLRPGIDVDELEDDLYSA